MWEEVSVWPARMPGITWDFRAGLPDVRLFPMIVEDDYDAEYRYGGRPIEPLQSLDEDGRVLYTGTFSKIMRPVLRLGFLVAPPSLHRAFRLARYVSSWHAGGTDDAVIARNALASGVGLFALSEFAVTGPPVRGLVFGYGAVTVPEIGEGLHRLRRSMAG